MTNWHLIIISYFVFRHSNSRSIWFVFFFFSLFFFGPSFFFHHILLPNFKQSGNGEVSICELCIGSRPNCRESRARNWSKWFSRARFHHMTWHVKYINPAYEWTLTHTVHTQTTITVFHFRTCAMNVYITHRHELTHTAQADIMYVLPVQQMPSENQLFVNAQMFLLSSVSRNSPVQRIILVPSLRQMEFCCLCKRALPPCMHLQS